MIAKLPNLTELTFDELEADDQILEGFWGEIFASKSLTSLSYKDMNLKHWEGGVDPPSLRSINFLRCIIPKDLGCILHECEFSLTTLQFNQCHFSRNDGYMSLNAISIKEVVEFATELAKLTSITSFSFTSCYLDPEQPICLVQCLREERERSERESAESVEIHCELVPRYHYQPTMLLS